MKKENKPKILYIDIETLANVTYAFNLYDYKKPNMIIKEKSIITFAYKWAGEKTTKVVTALDFQGTKKDPYNDKGLVEFITGVLNEADYVVGHYSDKFDMRFIRARALINNCIAPAPVATIDTYKLAKKYFHLNANRLDYIGKLLGLGGKSKSGWDLWEKSAQGDLEAIKKMAAYNKRDVELLEAVFLKMLPHVESNLNQRLFTDKTTSVCHNCGSDKIQKRGTIVNKLTKRQRYFCTSCGSWHSEKMEK
jgi:hypothetical protein